MTRVHTYLDGTTKSYTDDENKAIDDKKDAIRIAGKLSDIRLFRNKKLAETDVWVLKGTITDAKKTYRENLRKIPSDYTSESDYDALLEVDDGVGKTPPFAFKHSVWTEPS